MWKHTSRFGNYEMMLGVKWDCECVCMDVSVCASVISAKEMMYITGMTVQICQDLDCSPNEHKHTHACMGCPILLKSSAFKQEGMKKLPHRSSGLSNIAAALTTTTVKQQIYIQPHHPTPFLENVISHSHLG